MGPRLGLAFLLLVAFLGVNDLFGPADRNIANLEEALKGMSGSVAGQLSAFNGPLYSTVDPISGKISELIELQLRAAVEVHQASERPFQRALWVTSAVALVAVLACLRGPSSSPARSRSRSSRMRRWRKALPAAT